ncbi:MAG: GTP pyrophosphokinase family protein [Lachnospiraceae bacterium]|nr:GTP pyrophosphokinase family protein [Lachnospiraceae bacterium]
MDIQLWKEILLPYQMAVSEITLKFNGIISEHRNFGTYSPIEQVNGRVKKISSILEKCQKKGTSVDDIENNIEDIAGIRIICQFVEDIYKVVDMIKNRSDFEIIQEKDYITNQKESGYRSYHLIALYEVQMLSGPKKVKVEIQIRTLAMNFWATVEHSLQYKYKHNIPPHVRKKLSNAADAIITLDEQMSEIREEIADAQNSFQIKANIIADILNTIQNLYSIANKREIVKIQDEFFRVYKTDDLEKLERFSKELDIIAEGYRAQ